MPSRAVSTLLLLLLACSTRLCRAQDQGAPLYASTGVVVNGTKPLAHEAIPGDVIDIPPNNTAVLHPGGDEVFLAPQSSAVYMKQSVQLRYGTTKVSTKNGLGLVVHHYHVVPTVPTAAYEVMWTNAGGRVRVYDGEVRIDGCDKKLTVPKDKIAELGRDCKLGAYLRPPSSTWDRFMIPASIAAPSGPIICYYLCRTSDSSQCLNDQSGIGCTSAH